jgi:hypothetical protein
MPPIKHSKKVDSTNLGELQQNVAWNVPSMIAIYYTHQDE